jgi:RNA polymerase sigma-70 factor (ECF subfamily)
VLHVSWLGGLGELGEDRLSERQPHAQRLPHAHRLPLAAVRAARRLGDRRCALADSLTDERTRDAVLRARAGDREAFGQLFAEHEAAVLRICRRILGSQEAAFDARSEVFLRARRALATYDIEREFRPWLFGVASNHCIDLLRHRATEQRVFSDAEPTDADLHASPTENAQVSPLSRLLALEERSAVDRAIEALPVRYRLPLILRYFGDHDYATIAEALGVTTGQVGSLLFRAKRMLRERVADEHGEIE